MSTVIAIDFIVTLGESEVKRKKTKGQIVQYYFEDHSKKQIWGLLSQGSQKATE